MSELLPTKKLFHFGVYGIIEQDYQYLLVHKSRGPYKGLLDLPGGRPEHGESFDKTLKREILEETGLIVKQFTLLKDFSVVVPYINDLNEPVEMHHLGLIYKINEHDHSNFNSNIVLEDVKGAQWFSKNLIDKKSCSPLVIEAL